MDDLTKLRKDQLDALRELGNIGSGNACTALAQFLNRKIEMTVPMALIVPFGKVVEHIGNPEELTLGIFLKVMGNISGRFLLLIPEHTALRILHLMIPGCQVESPRKMTELEASCLREVGNILAGSFLSALSVLTRTPMLNSLPSMAIDMSGALIDQAVADMAAVSDSALVIETSFLESGENLNIHILLLPDQGSLAPILELLGMK